MPSSPAADTHGDVVLAVDIGGTSLRAALIDRAGAFVAEHAIDGPAIRGRGAESEIDPDDWWRCFVRAAGELQSLAPRAFARVRAIAACGVTRTQVLLGANGAPLRPAMTWRDSRAEAVVLQLLASADRAHPEALHLNGYHPVARLLWLKTHEPEVFSDIRTILDPKDYLAFRLTGARASDAISLARLHASSRPGPTGRSLLDPFGGARLLPALLPPTGQVGAVADGLPRPLEALAGTPVICCSNDTWAAVVGLGAMRPGLAYNISGTTEVFGVLSDAPVSAEGLLTVDWSGLHQLGGPGQNGADTLRWLVEVLGLAEAGREIGAAVEALLAKQRNPQPLIFLPYLQGERTPYWDPALRGAFIGLGRGHEGVDLAYAVLEGVAFHNRIVLERAEAATGTPVTEIRFGGGASRSARWRQIKADICGRSVAVGAANEPGLLGAAAVAWTGLGVFPSLAEAQGALVLIGARYAPDPAAQRRYARLFDMFRSAESALSPISRGLAAFDSSIGIEIQPVMPSVENGDER